jgi:hypothetical protein
MSRNRGQSTPEHFARSQMLATYPGRGPGWLTFWLTFMAQHRSTPLNSVLCWGRVSLAAQG